jgi:DnaJ-class molecular chaperone
VSKLAPLEIQALAKIMDELDYYQILHLEPGVASSEIKRAFHSTSRTFHPDVNRHLSAELVEDCSRISKRITEAYCVLRDPRRRKAYDQRLEQKDGLRMQLSEARAAHAKQDMQERQGKTPQGRQFHQKATEDMARGDWAAAERNFKMALTFEPDNAFFKELAEEARKKK